MSAVRCLMRSVVFTHRCLHAVMEMSDKPWQIKGNEWKTSKLGHKENVSPLHRSDDWGPVVIKGLNAHALIGSTPPSQTIDSWSVFTLCEQPVREILNAEQKSREYGCTKERFWPETTCFIELGW